MAELERRSLLNECASGMEPPRHMHNIIVGLHNMGPLRSSEAVLAGQMKDLASLPCRCFNIIFSNSLSASSLVSIAFTANAFAAVFESGSNAEQ